MRSGQAAVAAGTAISLLGLAGCGNAYRPVVSAINPVGPAGQPTKYAVAVSNPNPGTNTPGLVTVVDFSGDTVLSTPSILPDPTYFALSGGSTAYVINAKGELDNFSLSNPETLMTNKVNETTLLAGAAPVSVSAFAGSTSGAAVYIPQAGRSSVATLTGTTTPSLLQELSVGANPVYVVGTDNAARVYALSQTAGTGSAAAIETRTTLPTISATLPVGQTPVYGVMTADGTRAYVVNKGSGTVSVINVPSNVLDVTTPTIPASGALGVNPVWADLAPTLAELVVVNAGDGTTPGTVSIISVPQCSVTTLPANPNCNAANPADAVGFGTVVATVKVGVNPQMVSVLGDGSRAYVINAGNAAAGIEGSVSVINLTSNTVTATIAATSVASATTTENSSPTLVYGHPNSVATSFASPTGKVYITSADSKFMTVLRTDTDTVQTHISLQGLGVRVLTTAK